MLFMGWIADYYEENDFVTVDGLLISVNYYYDSDETKVSVYEKR